MSAMRFDDGFPAYDWQRVWCHYCGCRLAAVVVSSPPERWVLVPWNEAPKGYRRAHLDHVRPKSRGGSNEPWNLVPCCAQCNLAKGTRSYEDFRMEYS